jgi:TonB family protein
MPSLLAVSVLFLAALLPGFSQNAVSAGPSFPKEPREILSAAAPFYDFSSPELKPWHLKVRYQLYDLKGKPTEQGTWDYWWATPKVHRSSWSRTGAEHTVWSTAEGTLYRKDSGDSLRYFERALEGTLLFPLPGRGELDSDRLKLDLKMLPPDKPELACVLATLQWMVDGKLQAPSSGMANYYCFDPATMALRMAYSNQLSKHFSQLVKTQGRYLARQVVVTDGKQKLFTASVETVEALNPADSVFRPSGDATLEQRAPSPDGDVPDDLMKGSLIKKTQPVYPLISKMAHEQGVVVLGAVIGTDGRIHDLEVLASPSPMLAESAVNSVKKWEYKPYLLNGVAVEVETIVNVTYSLGN